MLDLIWILLFYFLMISTVREQQAEETVLIHRVPYSGAEASADVRKRETVSMVISPEGEVLLDGETVSADVLTKLAI